MEAGADQKGTAGHLEDVVVAAAAAGCVERPLSHLGVSCAQKAFQTEIGQSLRALLGAPRCAAGRPPNAPPWHLLWPQFQSAPCA